jgi:hypothetical protein
MSDDERQILELRAESDDGCADAYLLALGFPIEMIADMLQAGFAMATSGRLVCGRA